MFQCLEQELELLNILVKILNCILFNLGIKVGLIGYTQKVTYLCNLELKVVNDNRLEGITSPSEIVLY